MAWLNIWTPSRNLSTKLFPSSYPDQSRTEEWIDSTHSPVYLKMIWTPYHHSRGIWDITGYCESHFLPIYCRYLQPEPNAYRQTYHRFLNQLIAWGFEKVSQISKAMISMTFVLLSQVWVGWRSIAVTPNWIPTWTLQSTFFWGGPTYYYVWDCRKTLRTTILRVSYTCNSLNFNDRKMAEMERFDFFDSLYRSLWFWGSGFCYTYVL